jgi:hypothetical protein
MVISDSPAKLREQAKRLKSLARWHHGVTYWTLLDAAAELERRADELEAGRAPDDEDNDP